MDGFHEIKPEFHVGSSQHRMFFGHRVVRHAAKASGQAQALAANDREEPCCEGCGGSQGADAPVLPPQGFLYRVVHIGCAARGGETWTMALPVLRCPLRGRATNHCTSGVKTENSCQCDHDAGCRNEIVQEAPGPQPKRSRNGRQPDNDATGKDRLPC